MSKRITDLTLEPTKAYDQVVEIDKTGLTESKSMTILTLLRTEDVSTVDESGNTTATADFSLHKVIKMTVTTDCAVSFTGLQSYETVTLLITKLAANTITFPTSTGTTDSSQIGRTSVKFEIITNNPSIQVNQINNQFGGSLDSSKMSISAGAIALLNYFTWEINDNMCTVEAKMEITLSGTTSSYDITLTGFDLNISNGYAPFAVYETNSAFSVNALLTSDNINIRIAPAPTVGGSISPLVLSATFKIA